MTPEEVLTKAAEFMAERGRARGAYEVCSTAQAQDQKGKMGSVCAYGAMSLAATDGRTATYSDLAPEALGLIRQAAKLLAGEVYGVPYGTDPFFAITHFNDDEETAAEDVILAMKRAGHGA